MSDPTTTAVVESDLEVEARIYEGLLNDAGLHPQVRVVEDPILTNIVRQIALPRYQVVVPNAEAASAAVIVAENRPATVETPAEEEDESEGGSTEKPLLLLIGRILIWLMLLTPILAAVVYAIIHME